ncbi:unnamed protein product [Peronospora destructor]|uniref:Uncharacterized protein n=1 Tax=Peronospora destructor TaxID=86335 RepID=A0AAV0VAG5_9STRA|nr:unnamed protein product [Peronospora destructor]
MEASTTSPQAQRSSFSSPDTGKSVDVLLTPIALHLDPQEHHKLRHKRVTSATSLSETLGANLLMQLIPIQWYGHACRKGDWLPHWDDVYLSLDGVMLRVFESRGRFLEATRAETTTKEGRKCQVC